MMENLLKQIKYIIITIILMCSSLESFAQKWGKLNCGFSLTKNESDLKCLDSIVNYTFQNIKNKIDLNNGVYFLKVKRVHDLIIYFEYTTNLLDTSSLEIFNSDNNLSSKKYFSLPETSENEFYYFDQGLNLTANSEILYLIKNETIFSAIYIFHSFNITCSKNSLINNWQCLAK